MVVGELWGGSHEGGSFEVPPYCACMLASFIASTHHVMLVLDKVVVEVDVVRPNPPPDRDADLITISDVVGNGAVIDFEACRRFDAFPGV